MFSCYCPCASVLESLSSFWTTTLQLLPHTHHFLLFYPKRKSDTGNRLCARSDIVYYVSYYCCSVHYQVQFHFILVKFILLSSPSAKAQN